MTCEYNLSSSKPTFFNPRGFHIILEKVVASRIQSHLSANSLSSSFQSAYRIFHSTETTLLKIHNDLILAMDRGEVTSLILLDLSAAFDTVDHSILLTRLQNWFGLDGLSLDWFSSYLSLRSQAVSINDTISAYSTLSCGVPQGSVLGPLLFTLYTTPLGSVISKNSLKYHLYADDTQLYISFTSTNSALSLETLTTTFNEILSWMNLNKLLLNPSKTEFLLIGTKQQRLKFSNLTNLSLSNDIIPVSSSARNLGFIFDSDMSFSDQINSVSKSCHFHIRDIRRIRHLLPLSTATALANSLVSSKLDYCNSLYSGISQTNLNKLQRIQNSLARVITNTSKYQHITPTLKKLHWLPIKQRIDYKICLLTYKTLTNQQPIYLYNSLSFPSHSVFARSSDSLVLSIPYVRSSLGKRAFSVIGPRLWNSLPPPWYPKLIFSTNIPFQTQNTPLQNCVPSLGSFPSPWTVYPDFDFCYSHFMPYRMTPSVRHRAIEVHYYYYYYFYYKLEPPEKMSRFWTNKITRSNWIPEKLLAFNLGNIKFFWST